MSGKRVVLNHPFFIRCLKENRPFSHNHVYPTVFSSFPIPLISHLTTSPFLRNFGGFIPIATPPGVPVAMIRYVPGAAASMSASAIF